MVQIQENGVYTPGDLAEIFHCDRHRVCAWIQSGWLKAFMLSRDGRNYLVLGTEVLDMVRRFMGGQYPDE